MFDKRSCFSRAKSLLATQDDQVLRYVCLELRLCIEAITYDKLRTYANRLPPKVIETWQPPQAMKALLQLEPRAERDFTLRISPEGEPGQPSGDWTELGSHAALKLPWLRKTYNKLGSYLHIPSPRVDELRPQHATTAKLRHDLDRILADLEAAVQSRLDCSMAFVVSFPCSQCGMTVPCNSDSLRERGTAECLNPSCGASFLAEACSDGGFMMRLDEITVSCCSCKKDTPVERQRLQVGFTFVCRECSAIHKVVEPVWAYTLASEVETEGV